MDGGIGVGRVTKPGLGLVIGTAAINPVPMRMIIQSVNDVFEIYDKVIKNNGLNVIISVPAGEEIAKKTDNPRLGIIGGISILVQPDWFFLIPRHHLQHQLDRV